MATTSKPETAWMPDAPLLLTCLQVAALLGCSERTVKRLLSRRELTRRKVGGLTRIPRSSVEAFVRRGDSSLKTRNSSPQDA